MRLTGACVPGINKEASGKRGSHEVDALGGATGKDNLLVVAGIDEGLHLTAHGLVAVGGGSRKMMGAAMDIAIEMTIVVVDSLDDTQRLLRSGGIVEVDQRMAVDDGIEDGDLGSDVHFFVVK